MIDIEVVLTDLSEITTRDIAKTENPQGLNEKLRVVTRGGKAAKIAKEYYEKETKRSVISTETVVGKRYKSSKKISLK